MNPIQIITKKRDKEAHTGEEIAWLIAHYTRGKIPDYQMSAWLMAALLNGLNRDETVNLTRAMQHSGRSVSLNRANGQAYLIPHASSGMFIHLELVNPI